MRTILITLLLCCCVGATAQSWVGVKAGPNLFTAGKEFRMRAGLSTGITYEYRFDKLAIGADALFIQKGYGFNIYHELGSTLPPIRVDFRLNYVSLPLKAIYYFGGRVYGNVAIGVVPGIMVKATSTIDDARPEENQYLKSFDLSALLNAGIGYNLKPGLALEVNLDYQTGFYTRMFKSPAYGPIYLNGASLQASLKYRLGS